MAIRSAVPGRMPPAPSGRDAGRVLRVLALIAVAIGLAALTAAACVLSYSSIHHLATLASVSPQLAQLYPLIFDALLVVAGCCVLALRGAGLVSRVYSWLCLLALLGALAAGGAVRAAAVRVPHRLAGILAAVIPWALVLIGFGLLLALLRYARIRRLGQQPGRPESEPTADPAELVVIENTAAPPGPAVGPAAVGPAAIVPGLARAPGPGAPGVLPSPTRTGGSVESPAAPQAQRVEAGPAEAPPVEAAPVQPAPVRAAPVQPTQVPAGHVQADPVQPAPVQAGPVQAGQRAHAAVRQADLQLRARIPRQPAGQQEQAIPVTSRHTPFMPPVGPMPTAEAAAPGDAATPGDAADSDTDTDTEVDGTAAPAAAAGNAQPTNPRRSPAPPAGGGETPRSDAAASTAQPNVAETSPGAAEPGPGPGTGVPSADAPVTTTGLSAAPVTGDEPGEPPALRRPRSSPTPPED